MDMLVQYNNQLNDMRMEVISVMSSKDPNQFNGICNKCSQLFLSVVAMHPETFDSEDKRKVIDFLRNLKGVCLQLIEVKKVIGGDLDFEENAVSQDQVRTPEEAPMQSENAKVYQLTNNPRTTVANIEDKISDYVNRRAA